jgi:hypothetical protein
MSFPPLVDRSQGEGWVNKDPVLSSANGQRTRRGLSEYGSCSVLSKWTEDKERAEWIWILSCPQQMDRGQGDGWVNMDPVLSSANGQRTRRWLSEYGSCVVLSKWTEDKERVEWIGILSYPQLEDTGQGEGLSNEGSCPVLGQKKRRLLSEQGFCLALRQWIKTMPNE